MADHLGIRDQRGKRHFNAVDLHDEIAVFQRHDAVCNDLTVGIQRLQFAVQGILARDVNLNRRNGGGGAVGYQRGGVLHQRAGINADFAG